MEHWTVLGLGLGGFALTAFFVILLHSALLKAFQEQIAIERREGFRIQESTIDLKIKQHDQIMTALISQDRVLTVVADDVKVIRNRLHP